MFDVFVIVYRIRSCYVRLRYICIIYLSHTHADAIVGLLINRSMYFVASECGFCFILINVKRYYVVALFISLVNVVTLHNLSSKNGEFHHTGDSKAYTQAFVQMSHQQNKIHNNILLPDLR